jgi:hypothetical protein
VRQDFGRWRLAGMSTAALSSLLVILWLACHDHGTVNTFCAMSKALMANCVTRMGADALNTLLSIQGVAKQKADGDEKARDKIFSAKSPINHFILRLTVYLCPSSNKAWQRGGKFMEWCIANKMLFPGELYVLQGLMAIRGSRNGVFWVRARYAASRARAPGRARRPITRDPAARPISLHRRTRW